MKLLVIGGGGREHALAWKLAQDTRVEKVFVAPGNAGTALEPKLENIAIQINDIPALVAFAQKNSVYLTVIGPEIPLVAGIVDRFTENNLRCFGPSQGAAQLEGSKAFTSVFEDRGDERPLGLTIGIKDASGEEPVYISIFYENNQ